MSSNRGFGNMRISGQPFNHDWQVISTPTLKSNVGWLKALAGGLLSAYFLRVTTPAVWLTHISSFAVNFGGFFILFASFLYLLKKDIRSELTTIFLLFCIILAILFSEDQRLAFVKGSLLILLIIVVGPFFKGLIAQEFRSLLWNWQRLAVLSVTLLSFAWYSLGLPEYGKGTSGVTLHCMLLGPIAALASIFAVIKTLNEKSYTSGFVAVVSVLTCLLSGSRTAVLGLIVGLLIIPVMQLRSQAARWLISLFIITGSLLAWSSFDLGSLDGASSYVEDSPVKQYTETLYEKGMKNTRRYLWQMRLTEFESSPLFGIGIGVDSLGGTKTDYGTLVVEPGSSYLAVLSMTGLMGAVSILVLLLSLTIRFRNNWNFISRDNRAEVVSVGAFWAVHGVAEGWIFAGGSILCLLFWLWVAHFGDVGRAGP
jgi:O-antigen ligase